MSSSAGARSTLTAGDQPVPEAPAPAGAAAPWWGRWGRSKVTGWNGPVQGPGASVRVPGGTGSFDYWVTYSVRYTSMTSSWYAWTTASVNAAIIASRLVCTSVSEAPENWLIAMSRALEPSWTAPP